MVGECINALRRKNFTNDQFLCIPLTLLGARDLIRLIKSAALRTASDSRDWTATPATLSVAPAMCMLLIDYAVPGNDCVPPYVTCV